MKNFLLIFLLIFSKQSFAQKNFTNCAAAFLSNKMIVSSYEKNAIAKISITSKGNLTVCTANISPEITRPVDQIPFMIALKDHNTGTLMLFSNKIYVKQSMEEVLKKCKKGDSIVLITTNPEYALPHNEILVN